MEYKKLSICLLLAMLCLAGCQKKEQPPASSDASLPVSGTLVKEYTPLLITPDASNILAIRDADIRESSDSIRYTFEIQEDIDFSTLQFALCKHLSTEIDININGKTIHPIPSSYFLNKNFLLYDIGPYSFRGQNYCTVSRTKENKATDKTGYVLGTFSVYPTEAGFEIRRPNSLHVGDWSKQGMPFYGESVTYSKIYVLPCGQSSYFLSLPEWHGYSIDVYVNHQFIRKTGRQPHKIDLSSYLAPGENRIDIKISGYTRNITGSFDTSLPSGLFADFCIEKYEPY